MESQTFIAVKDVEASSRWYQHLLGCKSGHGGKEYERLMWNKKIVLQLHAWEPEEHPFMGDPAVDPKGNGIVLWFMVDDFDHAVERARELKAQVLQGPQLNPNAHHIECWLRDPDGYVVVLASKPL